MKRFIVYWIDKFGLEWSDTMVAIDMTAVIIFCQDANPGCHSIRAIEC